MAEGRTAGQQFYRSHPEDGERTSARCYARAISEEFVRAFEPAEYSKVSIVSTLDFDLLLVCRYDLRYMEVCDVEVPGAGGRARRKEQRQHQHDAGTRAQLALRFRPNLTQRR